MKSWIFPSLLVGTGRIANQTYQSSSYAYMKTRKNYNVTIPSSPRTIPSSLMDVTFHLLGIETQDFRSYFAFLVNCLNSGYPRLWKVGSLCIKYIQKEMYKGIPRLCLSR